MTKDEFVEKLNSGGYTSPQYAKLALLKSKEPWTKKGKRELSKLIDKAFEEAVAPTKKEKKETPEKEEAKAARAPRRRKGQMSFSDISIALITFLTLDAKGRKVFLNLVSFADVAGLPLKELHAVLSHANGRLRAK